MNEDGRMARLNDLVKFSKKHNIKIASIADLIAYRLKNEKLIYRSYTKSLSITKLNSIQLSIFKNKLDKFESYVISKGKFNKSKPVPIRVVSKKINRFDLIRNNEIKKNIKLLSKYKNFLLVIINNQMNKVNKIETDITLRYYGLGAQIIKDFKVKSMILLSRTKKKNNRIRRFWSENKKTNYY